uniref:Uncharacterized protein n=1 Tax=viral metagenome TaxID=1070528 RepID=A0A6M3L4Y3_9ZZZZ
MSIHNEKQNHPELIVRDIENMLIRDELKYDDSRQIRDVLWNRGVYKWFYVRRLLIQLKERWLDKIHALMEEKKAAKEAGDFKRYHQLTGRIETLSDVRQQLRAICHLPRDVSFPVNLGRIRLPEDFPDRPSRRFFQKDMETITLSGGPFHGEKLDSLKGTSIWYCADERGQTHVYFRESKRRRFVWVGIKQTD